MGAMGWYGFIPKAEIVQGAKNEVEFIIAVSFDVAFSDTVFRKITLKDGPGFHALYCLSHLIARDPATKSKNRPYSKEL